MSARCMLCGGLGILLGTLGRARRYRCRDCGVIFTRTVKGNLP